MIEISLKLVPKGPINNKPAFLNNGLVPMVLFIEEYMRHPASVNLTYWALDNLVTISQATFSNDA